MATIATTTMTPEFPTSPSSCAVVGTSAWVPPKSKIRIKVYTKFHTEHVYFEPKACCNELFFLEGFYTNDKGMVEVYVLNLTDQHKRLRKNTKVENVF